MDNNLNTQGTVQYFSFSSAVKAFKEFLDTLYDNK